MKPSGSDVALVTVEGLGDAPNLESAARQLGVPVEDVDASFGLVAVDRARGVFCVQVVASHLPVDFNKREPYQGPFSDPKIAAFGPISGVPTKKK